MRTQILQPNVSSTIGAFLTAPTLFFILISVLKYGFHSPGLFDSAEPLLNSLGIKEPLGWNINLLILFGPVVALLLNISSILTFQFRGTTQQFLLYFHLQKKWSNLVIVVLSGLCLLTLFVYLLGENCR